jgi:hypothetical protein
MSNRTTRPIVRVVGGAALLFVAVYVLLLLNPGFAYLLGGWDDSRFERRARGLLGLSESAVVAKMGAPRETVTAEQIASQPNETWWGSDWTPAPTFPVSHSVLIYYYGFKKAFIYIGTNGVEEHVHVAGT